MSRSWIYVVEEHEIIRDTVGYDFITAYILLQAMKEIVIVPASEEIVEEYRVLLRSNTSKKDI